MAPKKKQEKMNLGDFLTNQSLGSWADEMDSQPLPAASSRSGYATRDQDGGERRSFTQPSWERTGGGGMGGSSGMGGRGASFDDRPRFSDREQLPLPSKPPFTAHIGNLSYDVSSTEIERFFEGCEVTNVRLVEDKLDQKPKGFGYVEFASLDGLKQALTMSETNFMGRNVKVSVAEPPKDRQESSRDFSDWSRKGPLPELPQNTRQSSNRGYNRGFGDNMSDAGSERGGGGPRRAFFEGDGKVRDFSNWERKGPLAQAPGEGPPVRDSGRVRESGPPQERRQSPAWGEGRSDAGSRPPRREFEPRPVAERAPTAADQDNQWRTGMKPDASPAPTPDASTPSSPQQQAPKERPRLALQKRTVSTTEGEQPASSATDSKASPFGAARPIDTATREREIDEKRQLAVRQKKEADDKVKEDKTARESADRAARAERADRGQATEDTKVTSPTSETAPKGRRPSRQQNGGAKQPTKENGGTPTTSRPSFSILQHDAEGGDEEGAEDIENGGEDANGMIVQDKETKPQEPVKVAGESAPQADEPTAQQLEEDGWSTVSAAKPKNNRRGGGQSRAIAS